jgi:hypothetical protein
VKDALSGAIKMVATTTIKRRAQVSKQEFQDEYLVKNRPVIVTDAISRWGSEKVWTEEYLTEKFGDLLVQVYDDLFHLEDVTTLQSYFDNYWRIPQIPGKPVPYVRWYTKLRDADFVWADDVFSELADYWTLPYFLPDSGYLLPAHLSPTVTPVADPFPAKGIFISAAGARTKLHKDPWGSDAILCQLHGEKRVIMYPPSCEKALTRGEEVVDIERPDLDVFEDFDDVTPQYDDVLKPGEIILVPAGWYHHFSTLRNSISLTWNFVHTRTWRRFFKYLIEDKPVQDLEVLRYFAKMPH